MKERVVTTAPRKYVFFRKGCWQGYVRQALRARWAL